MKRLKNPKGAARYLGRMLQDDEAANVQGALSDLVTAHGGVKATAKRAGLVEWRVRLMLWDEEEGRRLVRLAALVRAFGVRLTAKPERK